MSGAIWFKSIGGNETTLPIQVTGASSAYAGMDILRPTGYEDHQLAYCLSGSGFFQCAGTTYQINKNMLFFFRQGIPHAYGPQTACWMLKWVSFTGPGSTAILDYLRYPDFSVSTTANPDVSVLFDQLSAQRMQEDHFRAAILLQTLLVEALPHAAPSDGQQRLEQVIQRIRTSYMDALTLEELALVYQSSVSYLCRMFRKTYGTTPVEYLNRHRIAIAKTLLLDFRREIRDIAVETGFNNPDYFCTVFRRLAGCSPTAFREQYGMPPQQGTSQPKSKKPVRSRQ